MEFFTRYGIIDQKYNSLQKMESMTGKGILDRKRIP